MISWLLSAGCRLLKELRGWLIRPPARTRRERFARGVVEELVIEHSLSVSQAWDLVNRFPDVIEFEERLGNVAEAAEALKICHREDEEELPCLLPFTSARPAASGRGRSSGTLPPTTPAS